jgi:hypothetical protein
MGVTVAAVLAAVSAAPAHAQQKHFGFGVHGTFAKSGALAKANGSTLDLDNKAAVGGNLEWWFGGGRLGLRADATHTNSPFMIEDANSVGTADQANLDQYGKVDFWAADADFMLRLLTPTVNRRFAPFVSAGYGFERWDTHGIDRIHPSPELAVNSVDAYIQGNAQSEGAVTGSVGTDFFLTRHAALRLEAKDYWNRKSPYTKLSEFDEHHGGAHTMMYSAGLTLLFGGHVEKPGFVAVAPAPEPAPVVVEAPAPPPPPAREAVSMCVANQSGELQMVSGWRDLADNQLYVSQNGRDVLFATAYPTNQPQYVKGAPWYVAARPLVLNLSEVKPKHVDNALDDAAENLADNRMEFVTFGATQPLPMGDVLYIGQIDGTPLYATRADIGDLMPELQSRLSVSRDLDKVLDDHEFAARFADHIHTFYTVVEPGLVAAPAGGTSTVVTTTPGTGCVFQPMSSTHVVRRTRG